MHPRRGTETARGVGTIGYPCMVYQLLCSLSTVECGVNGVAAVSTLVATQDSTTRFRRWAAAPGAAAFQAATRDGYAGIL
jgi:hypothetical protein